MRLALSSATAPDEGLVGLADACRRKGLDGLELVEGDAHGVPVGYASAPADPGVPAGGSAVALVGLRLRTIDALDAPHLAELAIALAAPVLAPVAGAADVTRAARAAERHAREGARIAVAAGDAGLLAAAAATGAPLDVAWDFDPGRTKPSEVDGLIERVGDRLTHVRLFGGGPESVGQGGMGVGELMSRLARARWGGALVLTPSSPRYRVAWSTWLGRRGGWGCSGKATAAEPITLGIGEARP